MEDNGRSLRSHAMGDQAMNERIGDAEIEAAAGWLARRECEHGPPEQARDVEHLAPQRARHHATVLRSQRDTAPEAPLGWMVPTFSRSLYSVRIEPGRVEGFRQDHPGAPPVSEWTWP